MARLIVQDGDTRRRFQLNPGKMTVGSSAGATLTLQSEGVADVHVELEIGDEGVVLRPRPGVEPPKAGPKAITGPVRLKPGIAIRVGAATLTVEDEDAAGGGSSARASAPARGGRGGGGRAAGRSSAAAAPSGDRTQRVQRSRPTVKRGLPTWVILAIFAVVGLLGFYFLKDFVGGTSEEGFDERTSQLRLEQGLKDRDGPGMQAELDKVQLHWSELSPEWRATFDAYKPKAKEFTEAGILAQKNMGGTEYLDGAVLAFQQKYLRNPKRSESRFFLKRAQHFLDNWPEHPRVGEVRQMVERYRPVAELDTPETFADVAFEVTKLTEKGSVRDYEEALRLLARFRETGSASDQAAVDGMRATVEEERQAYFKDRMEQAMYYWDRGEGSKALGTLILLVNNMGDAAMCDQAARTLVNLDGATDPKTGLVQRIESTLRGYKNQTPDGYARLKRNGIVAKFIAEHDVE